MPSRGTYNYALLQRGLNARIGGRRAELTSQDSNIERDVIDNAVRTVISELDLRGTIRESTMTPGLLDNFYDYALPNDAKGMGVIDLRPQATDTRGEYETYDLLPPEEFDRRKRVEKGIFTIIDDDLTRVLRVSQNVQDNTVKVSTLEDTAWGTFDTDSLNDSDVKVDNDDFTEGNGSIRFQTDTGDTTDSTIGIQNDSITSFDISSYLARGFAIVDAKLTTADTGIHQVSIRLGSDSSNYYQINDSTQSDSSAFVSGWNKIRWEMTTKTTVGTPGDTAIDYVAMFWSRDTTTPALLHLNDTDWGFDNLLLKRGKYYLLSYYSRFAWQDTAFAVAENSANDSSALLLLNDEVEVVMAKAAEQACVFLRDADRAQYWSKEYERQKQNYMMRNPSRARIMTSSYYNFASIEGYSSDSSSNRDS